MLRELQEYAQTHLGGAEPGFAPLGVRWAVSFSWDGRFLGVVELGDPQAKRNPGRRFPKCPHLSQPEMTARGPAKCHFLADTAERLLLLGVADDDRPGQERFHFHLQMLREAAASNPEFATLADALATQDTRQQIQRELVAKGAKPGDKVTFQIGDEFPVEGSDFHPWWQEFRRRLKPPAAGDLRRCLLTGELVVPVRTHDTKIKGLTAVGGRPSGDVLVGFDKEAFESYGLEQSENAACSEDAANQYCQALNDLIDAHSQRLAGALVAHWFKPDVPTAEDPLSWLYAGQSDLDQELDAQRQARQLLTALERGERPDLARNHYYALSLSGNSGRVIVRDWMEGSFADLVANITAWFEDLQIVHRAGGAFAPPPKLLAVLAATQRTLDEVAPPLAARLWRTAVRNEPLPLTFLEQALLRARMDVLQDQPANHARMGLLKAYHLRKARQKGGDGMSDLQPYLNESHPSKAYQCGRLMAVLAALQRSALGDVGAGVVQRYYAAASTTPALVLGRLLRTAQFHLNKLEGGLPYWYEQKLAEISGRLQDQIPRILSLEEQSLFALGYYQQMADLRTKKVVPDNNSQEGENHG